MAATTGGGLQEVSRRLHGPERVAALLLAMGKPFAERLLPHFEPSELREISRCAVALGRVPAHELETLIEDFAGQFAAGLNLLVSAREFEDLLTGVIPPEQPPAETAETAEAPSAFDPSIWEKISQLSETVLAEYLLEEHPQAIALVVSKLEPAKAAKLMTEFPADLRDATMRRMLASRPATEAGLRVLALALQEDLLETASREKAADPHEKLARIINNMDRDHMEHFLQSLGDARPQSAEILKGLLFSFEDLAQMTPEARSTLLDKVQSDRLVLALKGTEADFREAVLSALPARARRVVESELGRNEAAPQREVADARREIVNTALELAGRGEIQLKTPSDQQSEPMVA
jgi:flagellar motor switch protein FliG